MIEINNELVIKYQPLMHKIANKFMYRKEDKEDLVQEFSIKLIECAQKFDESRGIDFYHYFKKACENKAIDYIEKECKYYKDVIFLDDFMEELIEDNYDFWEDKELNVIVDKFLKECDNHKYGYYAKMKYINGKKTSDIANELGKSRQGVEKRIKKFMQWFKIQILK